VEAKYTRLLESAYAPRRTKGAPRFRPFRTHLQLYVEVWNLILEEKQNQPGDQENRDFMVTSRLEVDSRSLSNSRANQVTGNLFHGKYGNQAGPTLTVVLDGPRASDSMAGAGWASRRCQPILTAQVIVEGSSRTIKINPRRHQLLPNKSL
jgi:hypothetical protein